MTKKEANEIIKILKDAARENSKSKARAVRSLQNAGILGKDGKLSEVYRTPEPSK